MSETTDKILINSFIFRLSTKSLNSPIRRTRYRLQSSRLSASVIITPTRPRRLLCPGYPIYLLPLPMHRTAFWTPMHHAHVTVAHYAHVTQAFLIFESGQTMTVGPAPNQNKVPPKVSPTRFSSVSRSILVPSRYLSQCCELNSVVKTRLLWRRLSDS